MESIPLTSKDSIYHIIHPESTPSDKDTCIHTNTGDIITVENTSDNEPENSVDNTDQVQDISEPIELFPSEILDLPASNK